MLQAVLPGMFQPAKTLERAIVQTAAAVTQNTNDSRVACEEKGRLASGGKAAFRQVQFHLANPTKLFRHPR